MILDPFACFPTGLFDCVAAYGRKVHFFLARWRVVYDVLRANPARLAAL